MVADHSGNLLHGQRRRLAQVSCLFYSNPLQQGVGRDAQALTNPSLQRASGGSQVKRAGGDADVAVEVTANPGFEIDDEAVGGSQVGLSGPGA